VEKEIYKRERERESPDEKEKRTTVRIGRRFIVLK
jgi:hypothetical protein